VDRDNRHIPRVIESADSRVRRSGRRRFDFAPRLALYYNDHPDAIIEDFDQGEYGAVLREIERHVLELGEAAELDTGGMGRTPEAQDAPRRLLVKDLDGNALTFFQDAGS
jgi:hypothetical protein